MQNYEAHDGLASNSSFSLHHFMCIRGEIIIILRFERRVCRWESCRMRQPSLRATARQAISRRLASAGTADPGDLKSPSLPGALQFATANRSIWGIHLARLGKPTPGSPTSLRLRATARQAGVWLIGNSRPIRLKIEQPWECKSPHADQSSLCRASTRQANLECPPVKRTGPRC
jgi:hypothetical protein